MSIFSPIDKQGTATAEIMYRHLFLYLFTFFEASYSVPLFRSFGASVARDYPTCIPNYALSIQPPPMKTKRHSKIEPLSLDLTWVFNDALVGFYSINISVGTPPQPQVMVFDTESSDIFLHSSTDRSFLQVCESQTPPGDCRTCEFLETREGPFSVRPLTSHFIM